MDVGRIRGEKGTGRSRLSVEFKIDELLRGIDVDALKDAVGVANCSGCDACSSHIDAGERAKLPTDRVTIRFRIDEVLDQIKPGAGRGLENCGGCDACMAS